MLNHITLMGRLVRDPELRKTTTNKSVASFSIAVDRDAKSKETGDRETDFIDIVAWNKTGEFVAQYCTKGSLVAVDGRLQMRDWTDKDGNKRRAAEVIANNVYFAESKKGGNTTPNEAPASNAQASNDQYAQIDPDEGELPF